jgi:polyhydroxyalkanoate synthase
MEAIIEALKTTAEACSTDRVHVAGLCLGGIMSTCAVSHLAQNGEQDLIAGLTLNVTVLDNERAGPVLALTSPKSAAVAKAKSKRQGYLAGTELATTFAWLRPNEMIWNNVVNNYLLGKKPPAFDLLYWNGDSQNMPAAAHRDLVQFGLDNPLARPGAVTVLGTPIDLSEITVDAYAVGAETDHLTPWGHCYRTVNLLGGDTRFVLSSSGHIAAIINPPGNPRARYHVADEHPADPEEWLASAEKRPGTWWDDWVAWLAERSGPLKAAPQRLGNRKHKVLGPAPGAYVVERSPK